MKEEKMGFSISTCTEIVVLASKAPDLGGGGGVQMVGAVGIQALLKYGRKPYSVEKNM